jgi:urease accessory protein UreE
LSENSKDSVEEKAKIHRVRLREAMKPLRRSRLHRLFYTKLAISLQEEFVPNIVVVKEPVVSHKLWAIA